MTAPAHLREQMTLELMSPENMVARTIALTTVTVEQRLTEEQHIIVPTGQADVWESYQ